MYDLYVGAAAATLVIGMFSLLDRPRDFVLVLLSMGAILAFSLRTAEAVNAFISGAIVFCFMAFGGLAYVGTTLVQEIAKALKHQRGPQIAIRATLLWLPLLVSIFIGLFVANSFHEWVANEFYTVKISAWSCKPSDRLLCKENDASFKNNLHSTSARFFSDASSLIRERTESLRTLPSTTKPEFQAKVDSALFGPKPLLPTADALFPHLPVCTIQWLFPWKIPDCIRAIILNPIHAKYQEFLTELRDDLDKSIASEFDQSQTTANSVANVVYLNLDRQLQHTRQTVDSGIDVYYFYWDAINHLSLALAIFLSLKILLYILVRFAFDQNTSNVGCHLSGPTYNHTPIAPVRILAARKSQQNTQSIDLYVQQDDLYVAMFAKGASPSRNGVFCWPHKSEALLRRIIHNKLFFNRYPANTPGPISINTKLGNAFCSIELKKDDCFAFSMGNLFAFTENVTFHLAIRIRAAILLQRRFLFATATGPGTVVLIAPAGTLTILPDPPDVYSNIDDVIGIDLNGSIYTSVQHSVVDTYFRSFAVKPESDTLMIRAGPHAQWSLTRLLRRFFALVLPF